MSVTAEFIEASNGGEVPALRKSIARIARKAGKKQKNIARQAIVFAVESAAKATYPGAGKNVNALPKKYRFRPVEKIVNSTFFWYKWLTSSGKFGFFKSDQDIKNRKNGSLKKILRGIKYWNKNRQGWDYLPFEGAGKYHPEAKRGKIPHAGWAKLGWILSLRKLGKKAPLPSGKKPRGSISTCISRHTETEAYYEVTNNIDYISKTSPQSAAIGLQKAKNKIDNYYLKKFGIEIERESI